MRSFKFFAALLALALLILLGVKLHRSAPPATGASPSLAQGVTGNPTPTLPASSSAQSNPKPAPVNAIVAEANPPTLKAFPALAEFSAWAKRFARGENVDLAAGERLALNRRNVMLHLIKTDPEAALAQAVPARWRRDLPAAVTRYFEQRVDGRGSLTVLVGTDFEQNKVEVDNYRMFAIR